MTRFVIGPDVALRPAHDLAEAVRDLVSVAPLEALSEVSGPEVLE